MKNLLFIVYTTISLQAFSQEVTSHLITTCGDHFVQDDFSLSVSVGDVSSFFYFEDECLSVSTGFQQAYEFAACFGDFNHDSEINVIDLLLLTADYGDSGNCLDGDLDHDQEVSVSDLIIFFAQVGEVCGE